MCRHDPAHSKWYAQFASDTVGWDKRIRAPAEGVSLKEALMNLADKIDV